MIKTTSNPQSAGSRCLALAGLFTCLVLLLLLYASLQEHVHGLPHIGWLMHFTL